MPEDIQHICCVWCGSKAEYEIVDPARQLVCEECAEERREEDLDQLWCQFGELEYLRQVEEAVDFLWPLLNGEQVQNNAALHLALDSTLGVLQRELARARLACADVGKSSLVEPTAYEVEQMNLMWRLLGGEEHQVRR